MNLGTYGILIAFGLLIVLMILNPRLSCFGRRIRSPFYPLLRRRGDRKKTAPKAEDYGFRLSDTKPSEPGRKGGPGPTKEKAAKKADDYGFRLD